MRFALRLLALFTISPLLTQCGSKSAPEANAVTGPFDHKGNYIEDWVDQPDKWYRPTTPSGKKQKPKTATAKKQTPPKQSAPTEVAAVTPPPSEPSTVASTPRPTPKPTPKPAPKPKPKPKPAPVVVRHKVVRGDNLSKLANRYGSSVSKIQRANNLSGTVIRIGQTLKIPK